MLTSSAERLASALRLAAQALAMRTLDLRQQSFIKLIAVSRDVRQQIRKCHIGAVARGPIAGRTRCHEDRSRKHGGRFEQQLVARGARCIIATGRAVGF
jgi:hypothetical protein